MNINETITRDCCHPTKDLKLVQASRAGSLPKRTWFCSHCGQLWHYVRKPGEMDGGLEQLIVKDYE
jgi:hypothetical protein